MLACGRPWLRTCLALAAMLVHSTSLRAAEPVVVYTVAGGSQYHRDRCPRLMGTERQGVALADAAGLRPCSACRAPLRNEEPAPIAVAAPVPPPAAHPALADAPAPAPRPRTSATVKGLLIGGGSGLLAAIGWAIHMDSQLSEDDRGRGMFRSAGLGLLVGGIIGFLVDRARSREPGPPGEEPDAASP